ncbi:MAG: biotin/lipoyl-containing protein, partial [Thermoanaerobaculia bacterium]
VPHRVSGDPGSVVRSPGPAVVVSVPVREGDEVRGGDPLAVLEAMKMEASVPAPAAGRVRRVLVRRNAQVGTGQPLLVLDPPSFGDHRDGRGRAGERVRFEALTPRQVGTRDPVERCRESLEEVRRLVLGYDVDPEAARRAAAEPSSPETGRLEEEILRTYVDLGTLFRRRPEEQESGRHSSEEYLFTYLRDLDARGEGLPAAFLDRLRRSLAHYGVPGLDPTPELEESLFRIGIAHRRQARQAAPVLALLERMLERRPGPNTSRDELRDLLDRLIEESQGREPALHDLAREVRYRLFDRPLLLEAQERSLAGAREDLDALAGDLSPAEKDERVRSLVECPQVLHGLLSERFGGASPALQEAILEVLVRRYYRIRDLRDVTFVPPCLTADYEHPRARVRVLALHAEGSNFAETFDEVGRLAREIPRDGRELAVDLYVWRPGELREEETAAEIAAWLARPDFPRGLRRVTVCIARPEGTRCFIFRSVEGGGYAEDELTRGLHPMIAQRLELWRLRAFR